MKILVLCLGNINRSPLCAEMLRIAGYEVDSAGFRREDQRAAKKTREWAKRELDIDLEEHRSKVVSEAQLEWADLIVLMSLKHSKSIYVYDDKITLLGHYLDPPRDSIPDPNYLAKDSARFDQALRMLVDATNGLIRYLET